MYNIMNKHENNINEFFDDMLGGILGKDLKTDIIENDDSYVLTVEVPGISKDNIELSLENDTLTINVKNESQNDEKEYLKKERIFMNMSRKYYLENSNPESINAKLIDGILTINIGKSPKTEKRKITID